MQPLRVLTHSHQRETVGSGRGGVLRWRGTTEHLKQQRAEELCHEATRELVLHLARRVQVGAQLLPASRNNAESISALLGRAALFASSLPPSPLTHITPAFSK